MLGASDAEGCKLLLFHAGVAIFVPLLTQLALLEYERKSRPEELEGLIDEISDGPSQIDQDPFTIVLLRQVVLSVLIITAYHVHLRMVKTNFVKCCLHELNEKSIS